MFSFIKSSLIPPGRRIIKIIIAKMDEETKFRVET